MVAMGWGMPEYMELKLELMLSLVTAPTPPAGEPTTELELGGPGDTPPSPVELGVVLGAADEEPPVSPTPSTGRRWPRTFSSRRHLALLLLNHTCSRNTTGFRCQDCKNKINKINQ